MRVALLSLAFVATASVAHAQDAPPVLGVYGGMTQSRLVGVSSAGISDREAIAFGGYGLVPLSPAWSIQIGGTYSMKGWRRLQPGTQDTTLTKLDYFEIPAQLRFDIGITKPVGAFAAAGMALAVRAHCSVSTITVSAGETTTVSCAEVKRVSGGAIGFNSFDFGPLATGGLRFTAGHVRLLVFAQYERGLRDVSTKADGQLQTVTFGGGLEWRFGR